MSPAQPGVPAPSPAAGMGGSGCGVGPLPPPEDGLCLLSQKGRSWRGVFLAAAPQAGGCWVVRGGNGAPSRDGQPKAGSQPRTSGMSWLPDRLFSAQKSKLLLELLPVPPQPSPAATAPPSWQPSWRQEPSANTHRHRRLLEGQRLAKARQCHPTEIPLSLPQPACHNARGSARFPRRPRGAAPRSPGSWSSRSLPVH